MPCKKTNMASRYYFDADACQWWQYDDANSQWEMCSEDLQKSLCASLPKELCEVEAKNNMNEALQIEIATAPKIVSDSKFEKDENAVVPAMPESFIRRATRQKSFFSDGGLSGCLKSTIEERNKLVELEGGGILPGTEQDSKEEFWKKKIRFLAQQSRQRKAGTIQISDNNIEKSDAMQLPSDDNTDSSRRSKSISDVLIQLRAVGKISAGKRHTTDEAQLLKARQEMNRATAEYMSSANTENTENIADVRFSDTSLRDPSIKTNFASLLASKPTGDSR